MTKIAVLCDTHIGARNDDLDVYRNMRAFFNDTFFPTLEARGIKHVIHMGDVFDRRKYLNTLISNLCKRDIFDKLAAYETHWIIGNHDCYFTNTNNVNTAKFVEEYTNIKVYTDPTEVEIAGFKALFLPWINKENHDASMKALKESKLKTVFGHLEITGFEFHTGSVCKHGISSTLFKKFDKVYSGHFHKKSSKGPITYLGSPYQTTWIEYHEKKGFHILDTETGEMEFIENPNRLFVEVTGDYDFSESVAGKYVRLVSTEEESKLPQYDILKARLEEQGCIKITPSITQRVEIQEGKEVQIDDLDVDEMNIISIVNTYIENLEFSKKDQLKAKMAELYRRAQDAQN